MSPRTRMIAAVAGVLVVLLIFFFFFIRPRRAELEDVRVQVEAAQQRTVVLRAELAHLQELQDQAPQRQAELQRIQRFVPSTPQQADFVFQVEEAAEDAGVDVNTETNELPQTPQEGAQVAQIRVTIEAQGGYFSIQDFFRRLYTLKRALRIDNVAMSSTVNPVTEESTISLQITARIFFELPEGAGVGVAPAPGTTTTTDGSGTGTPTTGGGG